MPPLVTLTRFGLHLPDADLYLDARDAPGTVFVSHAHADHCTRAARLVSTPETAYLHQLRQGCREAMPVPFDDPVIVGNATVTLRPAGHTLGAAMLVAESVNGRVAYTGDFKLRHNPFSPPVTIPRCDTLVMECTFGEPRYVFPPDEEVLRELYAFIDDALADDAVPVLLAYALGKGQELLYHLTSHGYDVVLHAAIATMCQAHVELGYPFPGPGHWSRYRRGEIGSRVLITTPGTRKTPMVQSLPRKRICQLTGWALHPGARNIYRDCDLVLPLSDHAGWNDLVRTAVESGARTVYTVHGHDALAAHLRTLGIDAEHLADHPNEVDLGDDEPEPPAVPQLGLSL
jgi:Cft2 family RNA processing exonuclease